MMHGRNGEAAARLSSPTAGVPARCRCHFDAVVLCRERKKRIRDDNSVCVLRSTTPPSLPPSLYVGRWVEPMEYVECCRGGMHAQERYIKRAHIFQS
ncbi:hypothetical protein GW17_00017491 [Ensete ventricosum]|nr:hypothetical protein GW17_00017491 [Ensete ventricosum]